MKCPKCGGELKAQFNRFQDEDAEYVEVFFDCMNGHGFFTRIKEEDLIEE